MFKLRTGSTLVNIWYYFSFLGQGLYRQSQITTLKWSAKFSTVSTSPPTFEVRQQWVPTSTSKVTFPILIFILFFSFDSYSNWQNCTNTNNPTFFVFSSVFDAGNIANSTLFTEQLVPLDPIKLVVSDIKQNKDT